MSTFTTSREIAATAEQIFAAFSQPERLARWWGPAGFTNTVQQCDFVPGGQWKFTMHGPDGTDYPNKNQFAEIEAPHRVVIQHLSEPHFYLTLALAPGAAEGTTMVKWAQAFEDPEVARKLEHICVPANEQNLDRLTAEVLHPPTP